MSSEEQKQDARDVRSGKQAAAPADGEAAPLDLALRLRRLLLEYVGRGGVEAAEGVRALVRQNRVGERLVGLGWHGVLFHARDIGQGMAEGRGPRIGNLWVLGY